MKDIKKYLWDEEYNHYKKENEVVLYLDMDGVLADFEKHLVEYFTTVLRNRDRLFEYCRAGFISDLEYSRYDTLIQRVVEKLGRYYITLDDLRPKYKGTSGKPYTEEWYAKENIVSFATYRLVFNNLHFWNSIPKTSYAKDIMSFLYEMQEKHNFVLNVLTTPMLKMGVGHGCFVGKQQWAYRFLGYNNGIEVFFAKDKEKYATPMSLLIDDSVSNCKKFREAGGVSYRVDPKKFDVEDFKRTVSDFIKSNCVDKKIPAYVTDIAIDNKTNFPKYD